MKIKTKIHSKMYDLTNFSHPGGIIPYYLINGKDGTALFESYHPVTNRNMLRRMLSKYEIKDDNSIHGQQVYDFTNFGDDPFVKEVRVKVYDYFKNLSDENNCSLIEATKINNWKIIENLILFGFMIINLYMLYKDYLSGLFLTAFSHYLIMVNNWHDAGHFSLIINKEYEAYIMPLFISFFPPFSWYTCHTRNHHSYTNIIGLDQDIDEYISEYNTDLSWKSKILKIIKIPYIVFIKLIISNNEMNIYDLEYNYYYIIQLIIHIILKISILFILFYNNTNIYILLIKIILYYITMIILFGIVTQINHIHTENFTKNTNFYYHQILTASNTCSGSSLMRILSGGLNCQIEHHLFPSVNSCHLPELAKIIKPLCKKHNIKYNESSSILQSIYDTIKTIKKLNISTIKNYNFKQI
jgi:delta11-fatty-acid desaturase